MIPAPDYRRGFFLGLAMPQIITRCGHAVNVDDCDYESLSRWVWLVTQDGYARAFIEKRPQYMHRLILGAMKGQVVDHRDRDRLNNSRANIRIATPLVNTLNRGMQRNNTSGFKGVIAGRCGNWRARIKVNRRFICLGTFIRADEAARAYDAASIRFHGEDGFLNFR